MVAVSSREADQFVRRPPRHVVFFLVFGTDAGLVSERAALLVKASGVDRSDSFQLVQLQGDAIAADPLLLLDEANAISMFGGTRVILIDAGGKAFISALEQLLSAPPIDCKIIIEAGALKKEAALRKLLEREKTAAAIECYPDSAAEVESLISDSVRNAGLSINDDARHALARMLGADRLSTRSEIDKLLLYMHGKSRISVTDVELAIADTSGLAVDTAVNCAFSGDLAASDETSHRVYATGGDPNYLLAMALRHAIALHRARLAKDAGSGDALRMFGLFGDSKANEKTLARWRAVELERAVLWINEAINLVRRAPGMAEATAVRVLWRIARAGRNA